MESQLKNEAPTETCRKRRPAVQRLYEKKNDGLRLRFLTSPVITQAGGIYMNSRISSLKIRSFVRKNAIDLSDYPKKKYTSFNDFFTRSILPGKRPFDSDPNRFPSPCDGKLTVFRLQEDSHFTIKGCGYTLSSLLRNDELAAQYCGGWGLLFRLAVDDYHRYAYPVSGEKTENVKISGIYNTVRPFAAETRPIYNENTREYTQIRSDEFGNILMMEVGALLVGRITNLCGAGEAVRGEEKGYFEFGGSSIIILTEPDRFIPDSDILANSEDGKETVIKMGESIGTASL